MADRVAIMHQGTLQQVGTPEDVYRRPANRFVAAFVGGPPVNVIRATDSGGLRVREGERMRLCPRMNRIHFFDAATGVAVGQSAGSGAD